MTSVGRAERVPWLLRATAVVMFVVPAYMVFSPLGAIGHLGMVGALLLSMTWFASSIWGLHDPVAARHPGRIALASLWLVSVVSYVAMPGGPLTVVGRASADRWLITLAAISAIMMVTTERVTSTTTAMVLVRAITFGATVCGVIAVYQFVTGVDPWVALQGFLPGMTDNGGATTFQVRGGLVRVAGTTFTPIELGVVSAMVLPLAVWRAIFDNRGRSGWHWFQCAVIAFASVCTISRSAILALTIVVLVVIPFLPRTARRWSAICVPAGVLVLFLAVPGLIATLSGILSAGSTDPSLATRLNNYPMVEAMVTRRPWTGIGPATYLPDDALRFLDNQYLHSAVEMGAPGMLAVLAFFTVPAVAALAAARHLTDPASRLLAGAVAGSCFVAAVTSATFDSLSFPVFTLLYPFVAGLSGSMWILARKTSRRAGSSRARSDDVTSVSTGK